MTGFAQEIKVNPKDVNVNSQEVTTVFLTFGGLGDYRAAEAVWRGAGVLRWRVIALDQSGTAIAETPRRSFRINK